MQQEMSLSDILDLIKRGEEKGYVLLNAYYVGKQCVLHFVNKETKHVVSKRVSIKVPVYRYSIGNLKTESNKFQALYLQYAKRCEKIEVHPMHLSTIGDVKSYSAVANTEFHPTRYLTYNTFRSEYHIKTLPVTLADRNDVRVCVFDIEMFPDDGSFPDPGKAKYPIDLATIFDCETKTANVFYLRDRVEFTSHDEIMEKIKNHVSGRVNSSDFEDLRIVYNVYDEESSMLVDILKCLRQFAIVTGWNVNNFDLQYLINRCEKNSIKIEYYTTFDGFEKCYVFSHGFSIDYMNLYKFIVSKNMPSMKLDYIANAVLGVNKIESDTFLDIAYNIVDCFLIYLMDQNLNLIDVMFEFHKNGAVLHVFNVKNILEPYFMKFGKANGIVFIASKFTNYYNYYFNEVYKAVNADFYGLEKKDLKIYFYKNIVNFLKNHITSLDENDVSEDNTNSDNDDSDDDSSDTKVYSIQTLLGQIRRGKIKEDQRKKFLDAHQVTTSCHNRLSEGEDEWDWVRKVIAPNIHSIRSYGGAYNKSFIGVSEKLIDLDFFSMYPTIMYGLNISVETARFITPIRETIDYLYNGFDEPRDDRRVVVYDFVKDRFLNVSASKVYRGIFRSGKYTIANIGIIYDKKPGFIAKMCERLLTIRAEYKKKKAEATDPIEKRKYHIYQLFYKIYANSIYGYFGYSFGVLFNRLLVSCVTSTGRMEILYANKYINEVFQKNGW